MIILLLHLNHFLNLLKLEKILNEEDFSWLREIGYQPHFGTCIITLSRRPINELEPNNGDVSNFFQIAPRFPRHGRRGSRRSPSRHEISRQKTRGPQSDQSRGPGQP